MTFPIFERGCAPRVHKTHYAVLWCLHLQALQPLSHPSNVIYCAGLHRNIRSVANFVNGGMRIDLGFSDVQWALLVHVSGFVLPLK
jgi:hypothetical protein